MNIGIVGTRYLNDNQQDKVQHRIEEILREKRPESVITGDASGVDSLARSLGQKYAQNVIVHHADWKKFGKSAGPRRNTKIIEDSDEVYAFWDGESPGTKNSIEQAKQKGVPVTVVELDF